MAPTPPWMTLTTTSSFEEKVIGHAEIRQIFKASGVGNIAGSYVLDLLDVILESLE